MKLAVSGLFFDLGNTGSGQYTRLLVKELSYLWDGEIYVIVPYSEDRKSSGLSGASADGLGANANVRGLPVKTRLGNRLGKLWFEQISLPLAARAVGADLLHVPYFGPPVFSPCPLVVTVHDLITMVWAGIKPSASVKLYNRLAGFGVKRASQVIADSEYTRLDIISHLKIPDHRVSVVYLGAPSDQAGIDNDEIEAVLTKYGLVRDNYILYIGGLDKRKNVRTLLKAFAGSRVKGMLALAGEPLSSNKENFPDLSDFTDTSLFGDRIRFLGWVPEKDKRLLYAGATFFVYPSIYEGFGLPPLEAMSWGAPVLCSRATSLPEVVGDAALTFDPDDMLELRVNMERLSDDPRLRDELRQKGTARARRFSWRSTAAETLLVYDKVLAK
ncbi:MAG: glycosyltransferase family 1 protein [Dehalococcoidia bacterium]|nr:glycosyltransferase family 1 protein [Dehalococcoidia bacterium]